MIHKCIRKRFIFVTTFLKIKEKTFFVLFIHLQFETKSKIIEMPEKKRAMLIILDGFGEGKPEATNAIYAANTPYIDKLKGKHSWSLVEPGGEAVGVLPWQTGGSDIGHNTIGSGRICRQPVKIIYDALQDKSIYTNDKLLEAYEHVKQTGGNLHLFGIGADSMIHAYNPFTIALLDIAKQQNIDGDKVFLHLCSDGRDNPPKSAINFYQVLQDACNERGVGHIASTIGRINLDRGKNWARTEKIYKLLTDSQQEFQTSWQDYLQSQYDKGINDEFGEAMAFGDKNGIFPRIQDGDAVINFCYRADRERQVTAALTEDIFEEFERPNHPKNLHYTGFIQYSPEYKNANYVFDEEQADLCMSEVIDQAGLNQYHIAGKEKIIFVTYNLNRCKELNLPTETDECAPQTKEVETFDKNPEMSTPNLTKILCEELEKDKQDVYIINYENCDQVGHTGDLEAAIKAVESVDKSLSEVVEKALEKGFEVLITADHGNADVMRDEKGNPHTAHSANKVPAIFVSNKREVKIVDGELSDIAPTFLSMLGLEVPSVMTGQSLLKN